MALRFERQMTDGMPVCIMSNLASYKFAGVKRSERAGTYATERGRELTYLMI
jgi:hypothetical protein